MKTEKPPEPKADPEDVKILDATIQSTLKLAVFKGEIDKVDAVFLLVYHLPEWLGEHNEQFVTDMLHEAYEAARKKGGAG